MVLIFCYSNRYDSFISVSSLLSGLVCIINFVRLTNFLFVVEQRRKVFEQYLQELLQLQPRPTELNQFLDINLHVWGLGLHGRSASTLDGANHDHQDGTSQHVNTHSAKTGEVSLENAASGKLNADFIQRLREGKLGLDDFELLRVVGKGSFGKVFLVRLIATGQVYAMKVLKKSEVVRRRQVEHTKAERRIMGGIDHPFVVSLRFAFQVCVYIDQLLSLFE